MRLAYLYFNELETDDEGTFAAKLKNAIQRQDRLPDITEKFRKFTWHSYCDHFIAEKNFLWSEAKISTLRLQEKTLRTLKVIS